MHRDDIILILLKKKNSDTTLYKTKLLCGYNLYFIFIPQNFNALNIFVFIEKLYLFSLYFCWIILFGSLVVSLQGVFFKATKANTVMNFNF